MGIIMFPKDSTPKDEFQPGEIKSVQPSGGAFNFTNPKLAEQFNIMDPDLNPEAYKKVPKVLTNKLDIEKKLFAIRKALSLAMQAIVENPADFSNADVCDLIRDKAKEYGLSFKAISDARQPLILHLFVYDPIWEQWNPNPAFTNKLWLGYVEKRGSLGKHKGSKPWRT
jgi:hypothetical protein